MTESLSEKVSLLLFTLACSWLVIQYTFFFYGYFGYDDLYYAELSAKLFRGEVDLTDHYTYRIVPLLFTGLSYELFGINDFSSALPTLLLTAGSFYLIYREFRAIPWVLLIAYALYFAVKWNIFYADKPMPDIYVSFFTFAGWLLYRRGRFSEDSGQGYLGVLVAIALFIAFNSKGTVILIVPLFLTYFISDIAAGRYTFWKYCVSISVVLLLSYGLLLYILMGNPFARFAAIDSAHYLNPCSYDQYELAYLIERLTTGFLSLIVDNRMAFGFFVAVTVAAMALRLQRLRTPETRFAVGTILVCYFSINFMSISLNSYNPVCMDVRHIFLFVPILAVCTADLVRSSLPERWRTKYALFLLLGSGILFPAITYQTFALARYSTTLNYAEVRQEYKRLLADLEPGTDLYGSDVLQNFGSYYLGFPSPEEETIRVRRLKELPACGELPENRTTYVVNNWYMDWHSSGREGSQDTLLSQKQLKLMPDTHTYDHLTIRSPVCE